MFSQQSMPKVEMHDHTLCLRNCLVVAAAQAQLLGCTTTLSRPHTLDYFRLLTFHICTTTYPTATHLTVMFCS